MKQQVSTHFVKGTQAVESWGNAETFSLFPRRHSEWGRGVASARLILFALGIFIWVLATASTRAASDVNTDFAAATKLYAEGKFAAAAAAYAVAIQQTQANHTASAALYFDDGNAEFKLGHLGRAIAAYRQAALIAPRDSEILGNLDFARNQVQGATVRPSRWQSVIGALTLNEGTCLTAVALWVTFALLTIRQLRPALVAKLHGLTVVSICITALFGLILAVQAASHFTGGTAVVTGSNVIARSGPFDDAQNVFPVHDGAELSVLDRHDNWLQVTDGSGKIGWLSRQQATLLPGA